MAARSDAPSSPSADMRVVVLHGKDAFLRLERGRQLEAALQERFGGVDRMDLDGTNAALADVLDNLRTPGLFAGHKLVVLENAEAFMGAEDRRRAMERYAENPCAEATLLMRCASGWRPGNFDKLVAKVGAVIKCDSPTPMEAVRWCAARSLRRHQAEMEPAAAELLVEKLGPDLGRLDAELGKLAAAAARPGAGTTKVTRAIVQEFTGLSREERVAVTGLIGAIPRDTTVIMIEHDMDTALEFAERITVLHYGSVIVEGTRAEVVPDPKTREVYLGD